MEYVGFEITRDSVKPSSSMLKAIKEFPMSINITQLRSFFGLVNQVNFAFSMKDTMAPFRELLQPSAETRKGIENSVRGSFSSSGKM